DRPLQQRPDGRLGVPGQIVQVALDDGGRRLFGHGRGPRGTNRSGSVYQFFVPPRLPGRVRVGKQALAPPDCEADQPLNQGDSPMSEETRYDLRRFLGCAMLSTSALAEPMATGLPRTERSAVWPQTLLGLEGSPCSPGGRAGTVFASLDWNPTCWR